MIAIIDYDAGNLRSVEKAFQAVGAECMVTRDREEILSAQKVVLPGVGSFQAAMEQLQQYGLIEVLAQVAKNNRPLLGICLGMQVLFHSSEEGQGVQGLGLLPGEILKIPDTPGLKIPHMGWNSLRIVPGTKLFRGIDQDSYVYFVHSYYLKASEAAVVAAVAEYSTEIDAAVEYQNIFGCQFHPEKSGATGLKILKNFVELA